jgi:NAD(P)-dependent dehydrogenase (short-subunit alcohol dehydrogenase family)
VTLLDGKVAVVAGAGMGLGRATALTLAREGAQVVVAARRSDRVEAIARQVEQAGGSVVAVTADVSSRDDCRRLAEITRTTFGAIDILVANAAHPGRTGPLLSLDDDDLLRPLEVNLLGTLNVVREVEPTMRDGGGGCIVLVGSLVGVRVVDDFGAYAVSKAALLHAGRYLARELGPRNIRVNTILPGTIAGRAADLYLESMAANDTASVDEVRSALLGQTSLGRLPTPTEVAGSILYLASNLSSGMTGQSFAVSCGQWDAYAQPVPL